MDTHKPSLCHSETKMQAEQASQWSFNSLREREKTWLRDFDSQKQFSSPSFVPGYEPASFSIIDAAWIHKLNAFILGQLELLIFEQNYR